MNGADGIAERLGKPRRWRECGTCHDIGMVENDRCEDVCPECEGGVWRDRESWRWWLHRQPFFGWRICTTHIRLPPIYRDFPA